MLLWACSNKQNTVVSRGYHATTTKYNILYNGQLAYDKGVESLKSKYIDDFQEILPVERLQPNVLTEVLKTDKEPNFQRAEEKAIKAAQLHSIYVAGTENNSQIDEAYLLLGKSRYHDLRYVPAIEAFNYILLKYPDSNIFYDADIWVQKTNLRLKYDHLAIKNLKKILEKKDLKNRHYAEAYATLAQAYINTEALDSAKVPLQQAITYAQNSEDKARYTYILGQLNSRTDNKQEAVANFEEVISFGNNASRPYVINAYAEKFNNQNISTIDTIAFLKQYNSLLKDRENRKYQDLIFHQIGKLYQAYNVDKKAIKNFNLSLKKGKDNQTLKAASYRGLADIYYKSKKYLLASSYYDSTMMYINPSTRAYLEAKRKRNSLLDIVKYERIATDNDSLLHLAGMNDVDRRATVESILAERKKQDEERAKKSKDTDSNQQNSSSLATVTNTGSSFYFYSPNALEKGKKDFEKRWGNRNLVDNWRWQDAPNVVSTGANSSDAKGEIVETATEANSGEDMRYNADFFLAQIPTDPKVLNEMKKERNYAYYQLGTLYSDLLQEYEIAIERLEKLLRSNPEERLIAPAKYQLYKIYQLLNADKAIAILEDMKKNHPNSQYTQLLLDPNAKIQSSESPTDEYQRIYAIYSHGEYAKTLSELEAKIPVLLNSPLLPKYELLKATTLGKLNGLEQYEKALNYVAMTYPNSEEGKEAERVLKQDLSKLKNLQFSMDLSKNLKLIYEVNYPLSEEDKNLRDKLEKFANDRSHDGIRFSADLYSKDKMFLVIHGIKSGNLAKSAQVYLAIEKEYNIKRTPTLIGTDDYAIVLIKKNWDEYVERRNGNYQKSELPSTNVQTPPPPPTTTPPPSRVQSDKNVPENNSAKVENPETGIKYSTRPVRNK